MPADVEFELTIPPALQARFDAARHIRLPWELSPTAEEPPGSLDQDAEEGP